MDRDTEIVDKAVAIQKEWIAFRNPDWPRDSDNRSEADKARAAAALDQFRLIGQTAAFFGGYAGMLELNDAIVAAGGDSIWLNKMWEGIAGWFP
jgi:hypothetical protein